MINIRELYMLMETIPEAGYEYLIHRLDEANGLTKDERQTLAQWITKNDRAERSEIVQRILCTLDPINIKWVSNLIEELQYKVIYDQPLYIEFIDEPSESVQMTAIKNNGPGRTLAAIFNKIKTPCESVWVEAIKYSPDQIINMKDPIISYQIAAIETKPQLISQRNDWAPEVRRLAFACDQSLFGSVKDPTEEECWAALQFDPKNIKAIENPTEEMKAYAVITA